MTSVSQPPHGYVPVPVVLFLTADQAADIERGAQHFGLTVSEAATAMTAFSLQVLGQIGDSGTSASLAETLVQRIEINESLSHRVGVMTSEAERVTLLAEALTIEARHLIARLATRNAE